MIALYKEWNQKINVISRKDEDNIFEHHILHSLAIARYFELQCDSEGAAVPSEIHATLGTVSGGTTQDEGRSGGVERSETISEGSCRPSEENNHPYKILDVGTGGGFPGIPLASVMPDVHFTLCDSIGKKIKVASAVAQSLELKNVKCVNCRAESLDETYDWVVSRAVTSLDNFYPWVKGKYKKGILYLKGGDVQSEIDLMCRKFRLDPSKVRIWPISEWLDDEYFAEKFVIDIEK